MTRADMDQVDRGLRRGDQARPIAPASTCSSCTRARLSAGELHLAADQQAHRRIWRLARKPPALPAGSVPRHAQGLAGREADVGAHLGDRLGGRRPHRRRRGRGRARLRGGRLRPDRRVDRADRRRTPSRSMAACSRRRSPTRSATRPGSPRCASARSRPPIRSTPSSPPGRADLVALARPHLVDPYFTMQGGGLVRRERRSIARRNISPGRTRSSATACATART